MEELQVTPRVTALLVTRNCVTALRQFLARMAPVPDQAPVELLVVDNGSTDGTQRLDEEFPYVTILRLPRFFGRTKALNIGTRTAKGDYLLLIEPEMAITQEQVVVLGDTLSSNLDAVAVAPLTVSPQGERLTMVHNLPDAAALSQSWAQNGRWAGSPVPPAPPVVPVAAVTGSPILVRRDFVRGMNYFDERYGDFGAMLELFYKIRSSNKKLAVIQNVVVTAQPSFHWSDLPANSDKGIYSADYALGAAAFVGKHQGSGAGLSFRFSAILKALVGLLNLGSFSYRWKLFLNLLLGQKIDGNQ